MPRNRSAYLPIVLAGVISVLLAVTTNIAATMLPADWKPSPRTVWTVVAVLAVLSIGAGAWEVARELRRDAKPSTPDSPQDLPTSAGGRSTLEEASLSSRGRLAIPAELPPDIADFTNREQEVVDLLGYMTPANGRSPNAIVIVGQAGIGKTALALRLAHHVLEQFPDGQLFATLRDPENRPINPGHLLSGFLLALGVARDAIPEGLEERAKLFRSRLFQQRVLLLLDDAASEAQVRPMLTATTGSATIITSRWHLALDGARSIRLGTLDRDVAVQLLGRVAGQERAEGEPEAAREIVELCGRLPLAIRIAGAKLVTRPHWALEDLRGRLLDEYQRLDELELRDRGVRASLTLSYQDLAAEERRAFKLLGSLSILDFPRWVAAALLDTKVGVAEDLLQRLIDAQLLEAAGRDATGQMRYRLHDLLRVFARERLRDEVTDEQHVALKRVLEEYLIRVRMADFRLVPSGPRYGIIPSIAEDQVPNDPTFTDLSKEPSYSLLWFASERRNLIAATKQAHESGFLDLTLRLALSLRRFLAIRGHWSDWLDTHSLGLEVARQLHDRSGEAYILRGLGDLYTEQGRFDDAIRCFRQCVTIMRDLGEAQGEGDALRGLAIAYRESGAFDDAAACFEQSRAIYLRLDDIRGNAYAIGSLAVLYRLQGNMEDSLRYSQEALTTFDDLGDERGQAYALVDLGNDYLDLGRAEDALACFERCLLVFRRLKEYRWEARALSGLGSCHDLMGHESEAIAFWRQALLIFQELSVPEAAMVAAHLQVKGPME
jgi:tetratricopeptide (TPR) repeat protein